MEQLTISEDCSAVSEQCSSARVPITTTDDDMQMYELMQGDDPNVLMHSSSKDRQYLTHNNGKTN